MTLPFTQLTFDTGKGWQFPKFSPDGSIFFSVDTQWPGLTIFNNIARTRIAYDDTFPTPSYAGPNGSIFTGIQPYAISNDGTLWGTEFGHSNDINNEQVFNGLVKRVGLGTGAISYVAEVPFVMDVTTGINNFILPDGSERLVIFQLEDDALASGFKLGVYAPATDTFTTFAISTETGIDFVPRAVCQDTHGDVWVVGYPYTTGAITTCYFWRVVDTGTNSGVAGFHTVTGLPSIAAANPLVTATSINRVWVGPSGFVIPWGPNFYFARYLVQIDSTAFTVSATQDYGSVFDNGALVVDMWDQGTGQHTPGAASFWFVNYGDADQDAALRQISEISLSTLLTIQSVNLDEWIADEAGDQETWQAFDKSTPALICSFVVAGSDGGGDGGGTISWRYWGGGSGPEGGDGTTDDSVLLRCWTYSLDGHDYYVLRVGALETLVYDLTTGSWSEWRSPARDTWRAHIGCNWVGMSATTLVRGFGSDVVAGDDATGVLWVLDPTSGADDRSTTGSDPFIRRVTGGVETSGRKSIPCNAVELDIALGAPPLVGGTVTLETSDDFGHTWTNHGDVTITTGNYSQTVEWRSLGQIVDPGRVFRITDNGGTVRISGADMR